MSIYVGNLSFDAEVEDLQQLFAEYGQVRKCSVPLDRETGRKRGFAFVEIAEANDETKAIDDLHAFEFGTAQWHALSPTGTAPQKRKGHTATVLLNSLMALF